MLCASPPVFLFLYLPLYLALNLLRKKFSHKILFKSSSLNYFICVSPSNIHEFAQKQIPPPLLPPPSELCSLRVFLWGYIYEMLLLLSSKKREEWRGIGWTFFSTLKFVGWFPLLSLLNSLSYNTHWPELNFNIKEKIWQERWEYTGQQKNSLNFF